MDEITSIRTYCNKFRQNLGNRYVEVKPRTVGTTRTRVISISDLHIPFCREDLLKEIVSKHSGSDVCVVNGDLFDNNLISSFKKEREIPFIVEYIAAWNIVIYLSKNFGKVILVDGNHDSGRFEKELSQLNPTVRFLVKKSPCEYLADGYYFSEDGKSHGIINLPNVTYAGKDGSNWWTRVGSTIFAHRLEGFRKGPLANTAFMAQYFLDRGTEFQCLVTGHSHKMGMAPFKGGRIILDQGALTYPMDYETNGKCNIAPPDLGYAIIEMDKKGNIDTTTTRVVYLGTYQEP